MRKLTEIWPILALVSVVAVAGWGYHLQWQSPAADEKIPWVTDYAAAQAQSVKSGKPLFLYFTATWCGPCQSLKATTWADSRVASDLDHFVAVKLDIDVPENKALAVKYHVDQAGIPFFVVMDKQGNFVRSTVGALPPDMFLEWMAGKVNLDG